VDDTNIGISIATLLMVFVLQNTQNRDSAALHLKLDEIVHAEPDAREDVRGVEVKSEAEIQQVRARGRRVACVGLRRVAGRVSDRLKYGLK
jgi:low affinity Fe/Cu permease